MSVCFENGKRVANGNKRRALTPAARSDNSVTGIQNSAGTCVARHRQGSRTEPGQPGSVPVTRVFTMAQPLMRFISLVAPCLRTSVSLTLCESSRRVAPYARIHTDRHHVRARFPTRHTHALYTRIYFSPYLRYFARLYSLLLFRQEESSSALIWRK